MEGSQTLGSLPLNLYSKRADKTIGREQRELVSQLTWCGAGRFDSRRPRQLKRSASIWDSAIHDTQNTEGP